MRLIDADYVLEALGIFGDTKNGNKHFLNGIETAKEIINDTPTYREEARLLTLEEAVDYIDCPVWVEERKCAVYCEILFDVDGRVYDGSKGYVEFGNIVSGHATFSTKYFGSLYRLWTAQPTCEQIENTPWKETVKARRSDEI